MRTYQDESDYGRIREFLREISLLNDRRDFSWSLLGWDYWVWHVNMNIFHLKPEEVISLWESDRQIVAMLNPDTPGEAFFQVHPSYHNEELLTEMLDVAEAKLSITKENHSNELIIWVNTADFLYKDLLEPWIKEW